MITIQSYRCAIGIFNLIYKKFKCNYKIKHQNPKTKLSSYIIFLIFILLNSHSSYGKTRQENGNKIAKIINGNISKNWSYLLMSWNKGNCNFANKRDDILITLDRHSPDIFAIHEANFKIQSDKGFQNYKIETKS